MKYLRFYDTTSQMDCFVLFSDSLVHADVAAAVSPLVDGPLLSAGMATGAHTDASGGSDSLGIPSLPGDRQRLNDEMDDATRDRLLKPLVPLIVGTADPASEQNRGVFLVMWAINKVLPIALREWGLYDHATACERASTIKEGRAAEAAANADIYAAEAAANVATYSAVYAATAEDRIWPVAVEGLRHAILIERRTKLALFAERAKYD